LLSFTTSELPSSPILTSLLALAYKLVHPTHDLRAFGLALLLHRLVLIVVVHKFLQATAQDRETVRNPPVCSGYALSSGQ
jgi:hypothetical protein